MQTMKLTNLSNEERGGKRIHWPSFRLSQKKVNQISYYKNSPSMPPMVSRNSLDLFSCIFRTNRKSMKLGFSSPFPPLSWITENKLCNIFLRKVSQPLRNIFSAVQVRKSAIHIHIVAEKRPMVHVVVKDYQQPSGTLRCSSQCYL